MPKPRFSLRLSINFSFILLIVTTFATIGYFVFSNWTTSVERIVNDIQHNRNKRIMTEIDTYIKLPATINESAHSLLESDVIDVHDPEQREVYFAGMIRSNNQDIYSISYGTENGEYYGARRNEHGGIEVYENSPTTGRKSRYYSTTPDLRADQLIQETGLFDSRDRDWYRLAKECRVPIFSPVYKHFVVDDLAISAAYPIYGKDGSLKGVLGTHLTFSTMNNFLKELVKDNSGMIFIVEKDSGYLIANSQNRMNFEKIGSTVIRRIGISESAPSIITQAYQNYMQHSNSILTADTDHGNEYVNVLEYRKDGLTWLIISSFSTSAFTDGIFQNIHLSILLSMIAIIMASIVYIKYTAQILHPIDNLVEATEKFSQGDFTYRAAVNNDNELGKLSRSFNNMASQIYGLINTLEDKIRDRTAKLEKTNMELELRTEELYKERNSAIKNYNELNTLHDMAAQIQQGFLPDDLDNDFVTVRHIYKPIQRLSGDMLDFSWLPVQQKLCGFIVDVSGHGLLAALRTNILHGLITKVYFEKLSLREKMHSINQSSLRYFDDFSYATVIYFEFDFRQHVLRFSTGGNNSMLASCANEHGVVTLPGSLIGMMEQRVEYHEMALPLQPGDIFVFCSDGLLDVLNCNDITSLQSELLHRQLAEKSEAKNRWDDAASIWIEIKGKPRQTQRFELTNLSQRHFLRLRIKKILQQKLIGSTALLEIAFNEALNNACSYSNPEKMEIRVKITCIGRKIILRIKHNGAGFNGNERLHTLQNDFFAQHSHERGRGLAIMKKIMNTVLYNGEGTEILMMYRIL